MQNNKLRIVGALFASLLIGLMMVPPSSIIQNVSAEQSLNTITYSMASLKPGQVMTPFGPMDAANVHEVKNGGMVDADAILAKLGKDPNISPLNKNPPSGSSSWDEYTYWTTGSTLSSFNGYWTVPSAPTYTYSSSSNQVLYIFTALQDRKNPETIIQPVLQYGYNGIYTGCNCWQLVSWMYVASNPPQSYYSTRISTTAGHQVYGYMNNDYGKVWTITTKDVTSNTSTSEQVNTSTVFAETDATLESWNLPTGSTQCSDLPGNVDFTSLSVNSGGLTPSWIAVNNHSSSWCHMSPQIVSSSHITLHTQS